MSKEKPERKLNPNWEDPIWKEQYQKKLAALNEKVQAAGYKNWNEYVTAVMDGKVTIKPKARS